MGIPFFYLIKYMNKAQLLPCPFCGGTNTLIEYGTRIWLGTRYGEPTHWEINHWCNDSRSIIRLKAKKEQDVINRWNTRMINDKK